MPSGGTSANTPTADRPDGPDAAECLLSAEGMDCPSCASTVSRGLLQVTGVVSVDTDVIGQQVRVGFDPALVDPVRLRTTLDGLGYPAPVDPHLPLSPPTGRTADPGGGAVAFLRGLPLHVTLGGAFWGFTILAALLGDSEWMVGLLAAATVATAGWSVFPRAWAAGRHGLFDMHVLMAIAALGAMVIGEYVEAGAVLFLFAVAQALEQRTLSRARSEVRSLMDLAPVEATVLRHGHQVRVPVEAIRKGETVLIRPGERIPVDGTVVGGASEVDAAAITGESMPEPRFPGDTVHGGAVNGTGALEIRCDRRAEDSALQRILRSIDEARSRKSSAEAFVDRFARIYTPLVLAGAAGTALLPPLLGMGGWSEWGYRALVLVVVACPCALVISTPVTVVSALTGAARRGILVKSGVSLEVLGKTRVVAFDKTGTVTEGRPRVASVDGWDGTDPVEVLRMAAAVESRSEHPIARAIVEEADRRELAVAEGVEMTAFPGRGARARVGEYEVLLGSARFLEEEGAVTRPEAGDPSGSVPDGGTVVLVAWRGPGEERIRARGIVTLLDHPRAGVSELLDGLRSLGARRLVLLSGDRTAVVEAAARALGDGRGGFDAWRGDLLPEEKVAWLNELREEYGPVLMVGDGVNDAPALAAADVGMAMGGEGTAVAVDTADIALMEDDLSRIALGLRLGRKSARIIRANIAFALAVKVAFVGLGGLGYAALWMAVVADMGSSLAVILNGMRTLRS